MTENPSTKKLGRFVIRDEENDAINPGTLFAHRKDLHSPTAYNINVNPLNSSEGSLKTVLPKKEVRGDSLKKTKTDNSSVKQPETSSTDRLSKINGSSKNDNSVKKKVNTSLKASKKKVQQPLKKLKLMGKPFRSLLEGVVLVISGYQNPLRGDLRTKALEMGARYKADWDNTCTHLICAFPHTPKFQQVWGKGHIVRKEWLENCHSKRKRLPWRRYALDKRDLSKPESEDEIPELVEDALFDSPDDICQSGSDTEDEIEKVRKTKPNEDDTDVDSETDLPDTSNIPLPHLLNIFSNKYFYLSDELCEDTKCKLRRYIIAHDGLLLENSEDDRVNIVISETKKKSQHIVARPEWVWQCNDQGELLPTEKFETN